MSIEVYETGDTGPSGHGTVMRGHLKHLLDREEFDIVAKTHQWGWNRAGIPVSTNVNFSDLRFKENLMTSDRFNEDYLIEDIDELDDRQSNILNNLAQSVVTESKECIVYEFEGVEDIWHTIGGMSFAQNAPQNPDIYTINEVDYNLDKVPQVWKRLSELVDEVWVPNEWVYDACMERDMQNVECIPYGIDFSYKPTDYDCCVCPGRHMRPYPGAGQCLKDNKFNFLCIARWYHIKGVDALLHAYLKEFSSDDDVRLFIKTTLNNHAPIDGQQIKQAAHFMAQQEGISDIPEVGIRTESISDQRLMDLMGVSDAFVLPSRAECVGIAWAQAMHAQLPVITTNWSAMEEYLDDEHAILIDDYMLERPQPQRQWLTFSGVQGGNQYPRDAHWADPDIDALCTAMRNVYEMTESERNKIGKNAQEHVHDIFDWEKCMNKRIERFKEVAD